MHPPASDVVNPPSGIARRRSFDRILDDDVTTDYPRLVRVAAAEAGFDPAAFEALDAFVAGASTRLYPGAVFLVAHRTRIVHEAAVGHAQTHDGALHWPILARCEPTRSSTWGR